jgi:hypothetical protein
VSKKFSGAELILGALGIGSGFQIARGVVDAVISAWKQADEYAKLIEERAQKIATDMSQLHSDALNASRKNIPKNAVIESLSLEADQLKKIYDELEAKRTKAMSGIGWVTQSTGGNISNMSGKVPQDTAASYGVQSTEAGVGARSFFEALLEQADSAQASMVPLLKRITALKTEIMSLKKEMSEGSQKSVEDSVEKQIEDGRKVEEAIAKADEALAAKGSTYRQVGDPTAKFKEQISEIEGLTHIYDSNGKVALSAEDAAAATAALEREIKKVEFAASGGFTSAIHDAQQAIKGYDDAIADIDGNHEFNDLEKQARRNQLISEQADEIENLKESLQSLIDENPGMESGSVLSLIDQLNKHGTDQKRRGKAPATLEQQGRNAVSSMADPSKHYQSGESGMMGALQGQMAEIGTWGDQVARGWSSAANSMRTSMGSAISDMMTKGGGLLSKFKSIWNGLVQGFAHAAGQMVSDWIFKHTIMTIWSSLFKTKDVATTAAAESAKTGIVAAGAAARTGAVAAESAASTGVTVAAAGTQSAVTGIAGVFRSIMELGPIAGPLVFAASIAGMIALVTSLAKFEKGGVVGGGRQFIQVNEAGTESVLNAGATSWLGQSGVDALNSGRFSNVVAALPTPYTRPAQTVAGAAAGSSQSRPERTVFVDYRNHNAIEQLKRDPRYRTSVVKINHDTRRALGRKV